MDHFTSYSRKNGVTIDLVRTVEIRTAKHTVFKETVLRSTQYDIETNKTHHQQIIQPQLLIPTSTPPSIRYKDRVLRFHYKVRISLHLTDVYTLDMPIVIGTWPRASVPIDDDDDTSTHSQYDDNDEDVESLRTDDSSSHILSSWHNSSTSTLTTAHRNSMISNTGDSIVGRSDSVASKSSYNSWKSTEHNLCRNTSQSTTVSNPDRLPSYNNNLTASLSSRPYTAAEYPYTHNNRGYRQSVISLPPTNNHRYSTRYEPPPPIVPTHILEPLPSSTPPPTMISISESDSSSFDDDSDDDLLAIIERKKRKEKRELRKKLAS